jgi:beta-glucanase (GH16 family)
MIKKYPILILFLLISLVSVAQTMPIDFTTSDDNFVPFGGTAFATRADPDDAANTVGEFFNGGAVWEGFFLDVNPNVDLDERQEITLRFYAFDGNAHNVMVKLENGANPNVEVQVAAAATGSPAWQDLSFDFTNAQFSDGSGSTNATGTYSRVTIFIDGVGTTSGTFLIDDISDGTTPTDPNELDVIYNDLVWADEFDTDGAVDDTKWHHQTFGPNGGVWFNGEQQHYTDSQDNSFVSGGFLNIVAKRESVTQGGITLDFSSARLNSKFAFTYGRVDVRARLPFGDGTWPAIWTLGKNITEEGAWFETQGFGTTPWPACGEIDIMEHGLHAVNVVSSALHTTSSSGATVNTDTFTLVDVANNFHTYSVNWSPNQITFMVDGVGYYTYVKPPFVDNGGGGPAQDQPDGVHDGWPFDLDQFLLLNVAMGGIGGAIDPNFTESAMVIDYVRVYQNNPLSTSDVFADKFAVYPNPSENTGVLNIRTSETIDKVELYNTVGQLILNKSGNTNQINVNNVASGMYLMKIYSGNNSVVKRVLIQ